MMLPPKVSRSTMAAQSLGSVKVLVQPLKLSLEAMATLAFSSLSVRTFGQPVAGPGVHGVAFPFCVAQQLVVGGDRGRRPGVRRQLCQPPLSQGGDRGLRRGWSRFQPGGLVVGVG